jgi:hypothetical protein
MLELKAINEILDKNFFIPHYQRGYRWTNTQVEQLLDDIDKFVPLPIHNNPGQNTFYCLQPVAVKKITEVERVKNQLDEGEWFEVIDGQQRLTTIFLIIRYFNEMWLGVDKLPIYNICYETRAVSHQFLNDLKINAANEVIINNDNIDFYYLSKAYQTIRNWQLNYNKNNNTILDKNNFQSKFLAYSKIIWYDTDDHTTDGRILFERLNLGKIPLTNAELIKAIFLSSESFKTLPTDERRIKKYEIARLWDEMEHKLNEEDLKFWSFITNKKRDEYETKIDLILDLISEKSENDTDEFYTFLKIIKEKDEENGLEKIWDKIELFYNTLLEWFNNNNYYHRIGYLISSKPFGKYKEVNLNILVHNAINTSKQEFSKQIDELIKLSVAVNLKDLRYDNHRAQLFNILLLFNVETFRKLQSTDEFYSFKQHKNELWSIEHIHARNSEIFDKTKREPWLEWLQIHKKQLELMPNTEQLLARIIIASSPALNWNTFLPLYTDINNFFIKEDDAEKLDQESEGLNNLALISMPDNSALNNSVFAVKQRKIIDLDKKGSFIPICTRRVFLRYYQDQNITTQNIYWSSADRKQYYDTIKETLQAYLPNEPIANETEEHE